uniref:Zinc finger PMZ-type domain-containing protein n=1 Tax=Lactuca sativa TaxID=4236 RepID=A0A9R1W1B7_LACSA|nr:hypothetical protein LSAT_V11C300153300 [Lactuca sativa]
MAPWRIHATMDEIDVARRYAGHPTIFSVRLHHGGQFTKFPGRKYIKGKQNYVDLLDIDTFSIHDIDEMMEELGHIDSDQTLLYYHFMRPFGDLDFGLFAFRSDQDVHHLDLTEVENDSHLDKEPSLVDHIDFEMNIENEDDYDGSGNNNGSGSDEFDDDNFHMNIDKDVEWVGGSSESNVPEDTQQALVSEPFYIFQTFSLSKDFKTQVKLHSIRTRREIQLEKNDKNRVRFLCKGTIPYLATNEEEKCPWVIYCSKWKRDIDWMVKRYTKEHRCLQTRKVKACDYKFLSKHIVQVIETNPKTPIRALREQLQREYQMDISHMKTFGAKQKALKHVQGDNASQYRLLRDYILEVQARNPDTMVKIDVESEANPTVETITFRRIYVCIGALKRGFAAGRRDFLGLDRAFVKGPYPGQVLSAVIEEGRDAPIINCIEFIREYIIKKIVKVDKEIQKVVGPLTPTATTILDKIKSQQSCTCKRWELIGILWKHGVAAVWDMKRNTKDVGIPESFVYPCYWLSSWKEMYSFKVSPINGRSMWENSTIPTTLLPPKHRVPIGRPKKKRTISIVEKEDFVRGNTASRAHRSVTCTKCNNVGHNARTCKGQRPIVGGGGGQSRVKGKGKGKATT